jgi:hypothetical protein
LCKQHNTTAATVNAHLLITAFLGTTVIFACFALFAALSPRRSLLYLGSTASSALMVLMVVQFGSAFGLVSVAANVAIQLYAGLGVFCVCRWCRVLSCDVHLRSLHSAHATLTINQYATSHPT